MESGKLATIAKMRALGFSQREIAEEIGNKYGMGNGLNYIGAVHYYKGDYKKAEEYLEKSLAIQKEIGNEMLEKYTKTLLFYTYKHLGKKYDEKEIYKLIKDVENIEFGINFHLYELLEDKSYLDTAYKQVQEQIDAMDDELKEKFLDYPIPRQIVEAWQKVQS